MKQGGFTLIELLVAMMLVAGILGPASLWLYQNRSNQLAFKKAEAINDLEFTLHKSSLLPPPSHPWEEDVQNRGWKIKVEVSRQDSDVILTGTVFDRQGFVLTELTSARFLERP